MVHPEEIGSRGALEDDITSLNLEAAATVELQSNKLSLPPVAAGLELTPSTGSDLLVLSFTKVPVHEEDPLCRTLPSKFWTTLVAALLVMIVSVSMFSLSQVEDLTSSTQYCVVSSSLFLLFRCIELHSR